VVFWADAGGQSSVLLHDQCIEQRGSCIALVLLLDRRTGLTSSTLHPERLVAASGAILYKHDLELVV